jgi:hypothetical protein
MIDDASYLVDDGKYKKKRVDLTLNSVDLMIKDRDNDA